MSSNISTLHRLRRAVQTGAIYWLDPLFADRHPGEGLSKLIRTAGPAVRLLQPNDRWNLAAFIDDWARVLDEQPLQPLPPSKRIFTFGCYRGQFTRDLVLAFLLAWRGHHVTCGYLPKLRSPIKPPLADAENVQSYLAEVLGKVGPLTRGRVTCIDMSAWRDKGGEIDEAFLASISRADTIMYTRREKLDLGVSEIGRTYAYFETIGRDAQSAAMEFFARHGRDFDLAVIANGASFENGHFCHAAKLSGVPVNTHEKFAFANVIVVNHGDAFFHFKDLDRIWFRRDELGFMNEPTRTAVIDKGWDLLNQRRGSTGRAWGWQYQKGRTNRSPEDITRLLGVERGKFALICPNVPFDAGYEGWLEIFPSMRDWLVETTRHLLEHHDIKIVARAHPAETRPGYGEEKLASLFAEAGISSDRLVVVPGDGDVNTYDLMPLCRFAAVFASTTGIEIAMHDKPVLAGASVYYARCGISLPASTKEQYFAALDRLAIGEETAPESLADDAAMLYFMFHYLLQWRFPYDKPSQITATPPRKLVRSRDIDVFAETLDVLAMTTEEFEAALPRLVRADLIDRRFGLAPYAAAPPSSETEVPE